ncbi:HAD-like domain-containing protein [Mycena galopus ATCC 62051]|nr:HAD-like domain-containing protein [Mycena galopus ATCC 62051]
MAYPASADEGPSPPPDEPNQEHQDGGESPAPHLDQPQAPKNSLITSGDPLVGTDLHKESGAALPTLPSVSAPPDGEEQGSLNTTLTGIHKRTTFYGPKGNKSDAVGSSSASRSIVKPTPHRPRSKRTFLARIVFKLIPCVHDSSTLGGDLDDALALQTVEKRPSEAGRQTSTSEAPLETPAPLLAPPAVEVDPATSGESEVIVQPPQSANLLSQDETDGLTAGAVTPPGATAKITAIPHAADSDGESQTTSVPDDDDGSFLYDEQAEEERLIKNGGSGIPIGPDGEPRPLLPPIAPQHVGRKCLVLDLDETLIHSSFKSIPNPDFIIPVEIEGTWHRFHVLKRPDVENFLGKMGETYEIVVWTAALGQYANPLLDLLDISHAVAHRLFRQSCFSHKGAYIKDLSHLGRPMADTIILDNSPISFLFHPNNAVPVTSWFNDPHDGELTDLIPFLTDLASVPDVRGILNGTM